MVAASLLFMLALAGLAIDLASLYVGRSQVQRAADAAALAGATAFVTSGYTSGGTDQGTASTDVTNHALAVGAQNYVSGNAPTVSVDNINFNQPQNPQVTVSVSQTVPVFFMKVFGLGSQTVSANATAEAYNPSGLAAEPTFCAGCLKPMIIANCDPNFSAHPMTETPNMCPAGMGSFIDSNSGQIYYNTSFASGGVIGEPITLQYQTNTSAGGQPYLFNPPTNPPGSVAWYGVSIDGTGNVAEWPGDITSCNAALHTCTDMLQTVDVMGAGLLASSLAPSIAQLINAPTPAGYNQGQDAINVPSILNPNLPYSITGGSGDPNNVSGQTITQSNSIATFPIYDGHTGVAPGTPLTIIGFMQLFIEYVDNTMPTNPLIVGVILNISGCGTNGTAAACTSNFGSGGSGPPGTISGGGVSTVPVRLISTGT
jgi:hypothetical protein